MVTVFESSAEKTQKKKKSTHTSQIGSSCMHCCAKELSLILFVAKNNML